MTDVNDGDSPKDKAVRTTFCVRFHGDEKERAQAYVKEHGGGKTLTQFIRELVLEKCSIEPSR